MATPATGRTIAIAIFIVCVPLFVVDDDSPFSSLASKDSGSSIFGTSGNVAVKIFLTKDEEP
jgi:hypothetical protein